LVGHLKDRDHPRYRRRRTHRLSCSQDAAPAIGLRFFTVYGPWGRFIAVLEQALGRTAEKRLLPMQPSDVPQSFADIEASRRDLGFEPKTPIEVGIPNFVRWYRDYHGLGA